MISCFQSSNYSLGFNPYKLSKKVCYIIFCSISNAFKAVSSKINISTILITIVIVILNSQNFPNNGVCGWHHSETNDKVVLEVIKVMAISMHFTYL